MHEEGLSEFSIFVKEKLDQKGWSMRELARQAGVSHALVSNQLSGYSKVSLSFCEKIAEPLGVSLNKLKRIGGFGIPVPEDPRLVQILEMAEELSSEKRDMLYKFTKFLAQQEFEFEDKRDGGTD